MCRDSFVDFDAIINCLFVYLTFLITVFFTYLLLPNRPVVKVVGGDQPCEFLCAVVYFVMDACLLLLY